MCGQLMRLDEAIEHARQKSTEDTICACEHAQLATWLMELQHLRIIIEAQAEVIDALEDYIVARAMGDDVAIDKAAEIFDEIKENILSAHREFIKEEGKI